MYFAGYGIGEKSFWLCMCNSFDANSIFFRQRFMSGAPGCKKKMDTLSQCLHDVKSLRAKNMVKSREYGTNILC